MIRLTRGFIRFSKPHEEHPLMSIDKVLTWLRVVSKADKLLVFEMFSVLSNIVTAGITIT